MGGVKRDAPGLGLGSGWLEIITPLICQWNLSVATWSQSPRPLGEELLEASRGISGRFSAHTRRCQKQIFTSWKLLTIWGAHILGDCLLHSLVSKEGHSFWRMSLATWSTRSQGGSISCQSRDAHCRFPVACMFHPPAKPSMVATLQPYPSPISWSSACRIYKKVVCLPLSLSTGHISH